MPSTFAKVSSVSPKFRRLSPKSRRQAPKFRRTRPKVPWTRLVNSCVRDKYPARSLVYYQMRLVNLRVRDNCRGILPSPSSQLASSIQIPSILPKPPSQIACSRQIPRYITKSSYSTRVFETNTLVDYQVRLASSRVFEPIVMVSYRGRLVNTRVKQIARVYHHLHF